ncbi:Uncharacterized protein dnl_14760 [Desulfonema limicola]|uniref:Uncharacterized protein n=1 Tax=Desulfonema limicola TaxID=45656 RepID=A0A975B5K8_9BACT|nr:hypothetical protein [Desulfonema limicola]QTA79221.1 Uncharacterized protein dnl_14760 [Desulfonema limicola]
MNGKKTQMDMDITQIHQLLKPILWDYKTDPYDFFLTAVGEKKHAGCFDQEKALIRMLERLLWYDLIRLLGIERIKELLTPEIISKLRIKELREKYEFARKILHGEPVSFSGWSAEYREKIKHTLLSNRWYRTQPGIFPS